MNSFSHPSAPSLLPLVPLSLCLQLTIARGVPTYSSVRASRPPSYRRRHASPARNAATPARNAGSREKRSFAANKGCCPPCAPGPTSAWCEVVLRCGGGLSHPPGSSAKLQRVNRAREHGVGDRPGPTTDCTDQRPRRCAHAEARNEGLRRGRRRFPAPARVLGGEEEQRRAHPRQASSCHTRRGIWRATPHALHLAPHQLDASVHPRLPMLLLPPRCFARRRCGGCSPGGERRTARPVLQRERGGQLTQLRRCDHIEHALGRYSPPPEQPSGGEVERGHLGLKRLPVPVSNVRVDLIDAEICHVRNHRQPLPHKDSSGRSASRGACFCAVGKRAFRNNLLGSLHSVCGM